MAECERHCTSPLEEGEVEKDVIDKEVIVKEVMEIEPSTARNRRRERAGARRRKDSCSLVPSTGTCSSRLQRSPGARS